MTAAAEHERVELMEQLNESIAAAFKAFDSSSLEGAAAAALAGEYYGERTFRIFADEADDPDERRFWELSRDVEAVTIVCLEKFVQEAAILRPDPAPFHELAERTAQVFSGEHNEYCRWVTPLIADALESFRALRAQLDGVAAEVGEQVFDHEYAFARAWQLFPEGFAKASEQLAAHLQRYGMRG